MVKKKNLEHLRDKSMYQALKSVDNPWELIAFVFAYRVKELLALIIIFLIVINLYPEIVEFITGLIK